MTSEDSILSARSFCAVTRAIVLVGATGANRGDPDGALPTPLLEVAGQPFVSHLLRRLAEQGVREAVLAAGSLAERFEAALGDGGDLGLTLRYSAEAEPTGSGGGLKRAAERIDAERFFVLDGDTLFDAPLSGLSRVLDAGSGGKAALALRWVEDVALCGDSRRATVRVDDTGLITAFDRVTASGPGYVYGGVGLCTREALAGIPSGPSSLDNDVLPTLLRERALRGEGSHSFCIEAGDPSSFAEARITIPRWERNRNRPFALLDRDGTIIVEKHYLHDPDEVELLPSVAEGLLALRNHGFGLVVVTNQSGIGRGYYSEREMTAVNDRMAELLAGYGVSFDGVYFCPHRPEDGCLCRKPLTGMGDAAIQDLGFTPRNTVVMGDKPCDVDLGRALGGKGVLVKTGYGEDFARASGADFIASTLKDAAKWAISTLGASLAQSEFIR